MNRPQRKMIGGPHAYEELPLALVGAAVGLYLVGTHLYAFLKPEKTSELLKTLPRNYPAGVVLTVIAMVWFWFLVAPVGEGFLNGIGMDLGEFNGLKPILRLVVPVACFLVITQVREFLFVRGLGMVALMAAAPILEAAFLKEPTSRLLLSLFAYILLTKGLFWVGMPYTFRDAVTWVTKSSERFKKFALGGVIYGALVLFCALFFYRGH